MRIFVLNFLIYYTFFLTSYAQVIAVLHFPYTFCKTCPNLSFQIFLTSRCSNITTSRRILFFEVFIIFFCFLQNRKGDPLGGRVSKWDLQQQRGFLPTRYYYGTTQQQRGLTTNATAIKLTLLGKSLAVARVLGLSVARVPALLIRHYS